MKTHDVRRQYKSLQRFIAEIILVIVAGLVIGYATGGLGWW